MEARFNPDIKLIENHTCYEEYLSNLIYIFIIRTIVFQ